MSVSSPTTHHDDDNDSENNNINDKNNRHYAGAVQAFLRKLMYCDNNDNNKGDRGDIDGKRRAFGAPNNHKPVHDNKREGRANQDKPDDVEEDDNKPVAEARRVGIDGSSLSESTNGPSSSRPTDGPCSNEPTARPSQVSQLMHQD